MNEREWWTTAPEWAEFHTWDKFGKTWWSVKPKLSKDKRAWFQPFDKEGNEQIWHYAFYDETPCPIEIDPAKTLRNRPKEPAL